VCHFISVTTNLFFRANFTVGASFFLFVSKTTATSSADLRIFPYFLNPLPPVVPKLTPFIFLYLSVLLLCRSENQKDGGSKGPFSGSGWTYARTHTNKQYFPVFNVFHVRALYYTKTLITKKCTKRVLSSIVTHSYMFRPCWVIFRESFFVIVTLRLQFIVE
jgi:hypothetical protein